MPMRQNHVGGYLTEMTIRSGLKMDSLAITLAADNTAIDPTWPPVLIIDPDGAKDVLLPAEAANAGLTFFIYNAASGAETITLKDDADSVTVTTVAQDVGAIVHCDGTTWRHLGGA